MPFSKYVIVFQHRDNGDSERVIECHNIPHVNKEVAAIEHQGCYDYDVYVRLRKRGYYGQVEGPGTIADSRDRSARADDTPRGGEASPDRFTPAERAHAKVSFTRAEPVPSGSESPSGTVPEAAEGERSAGEKVQEEGDSVRNRVRGTFRTTKGFAEDQ